jgi:predicted transcriptional regulator
MATIIEREDTIVGTKRAIAMTTVEGEKKQLNIHDRIRLAICSELRRKIFVALMDGKRGLSELRKTLEVSSTTAIHALRDLEKNKLIFEDEKRNYGLTKIGEIMALKIVDFVDAVEVLQKHEEFWLTHDLSGIPPHLMERVGWLKDSAIIEAPATDIFKVHSTYIDMVSKAKEIKGISPIFVPEFPFIYETLAIENKMPIQLVVTEEVLNKIKREMLEKIFSNKNSKLELFVMKEDIKVALTITDYFISLGFFNFDGTYDWNKDLIGYDKVAIDWGKELFEWYRKRTESVSI